MNKDHELGKLGEDVTANYITRLGYKVLERNFECNQGEIDIIALDNEELVFIEVKTRTGVNYGEASEAITRYKKHSTAFDGYTFHWCCWCGTCFVVESPCSYRLGIFL